MDIAYPLRNNSSNNYIELRYSLRSLVNIRHDRIFIAGGKPSWIQNIVHIEGLDNQIHKPLNVINKIRDICLSDISDDFILMNDDFYFLNKCTKKDLNAHGFLLKEKLIDKVTLYNIGKFGDMLRKTIETLPDAIDYSLHKPITINKYKFLEMLKQYDFRYPMSYRSIYGTINKLEGNISPDHKLFDARYIDYIKDTPIISSGDNLFKESKFHKLMSKFKKSRYEQNTDKALFFTTKAFRDSTSNGTIRRCNDIIYLDKDRANTLLNLNLGIIL